MAASFVCFAILRATPPLSQNLVEFIQEDSTGNLWIGTADGLNYYDRATERFTTYQSPRLPGTIYMGSATDKKRKRLWLAAGVGGLVTCRSAGELLKHWTIRTWPA